MLDSGRTSQAILDACEQALCRARKPADVTVRAVAHIAGVNPSQISYHFGSMEELIIAVARQVYRRLNAERLALLQRAVARRDPAPPALEEVLAALIGPSIRWSLDPGSSYAVLAYFANMRERSRRPELYEPIIEEVDHHLAFVPELRRLAPHLSEPEIGWRIYCALGIRSQVLHRRRRAEILSYQTIDFGNAEELIGQIVAVTAPMFRPAGGEPTAGSNAV